MCLFLQILLTIGIIVGGIAALAIFFYVCSHIPTWLENHSSNIYRTIGKIVDVIATVCMIAVLLFILGAAIYGIWMEAGEILSHCGK